MKKLAKRVSQKRKTAPVSTKVSVGARAAAKETASRTLWSVPIVGVGASAGGLEAMSQLLEALPTDTGMAFVLVQHLEPKHESMLTKLLAKATAMPVQEVREGMRVQPNQVYLIPANADMSLFDGLLHIVGRKAPPGHHLPIDYFFHSLAEARRSQAIGVILSGTASDGTAGLRAIKEAGGITFAQQPDTAKFDGMPRSAISAGCVDFVLPVERIAKELARIARHPSVRVPPPEAVPAILKPEDEWTRLFRLLRTSSGVDFSYYRKPTIKRRLARRMAARKIERLGAYLKLLESSREELEALFREFAIGVTDFFRDPDVFLTLRKKILPQILAAKSAGEPLRIWVTGCSTGEEAYSIAICALEHLGEKAADTPIQIFGTDISDAAIGKARAGVYPEAALKGVSQERRRRFFTRVNGNYQVNQNIREMCVFARQDVTKDPPFSKLDLISCRNVLIYFEPVLQKKALALFHYALRSQGVLLLGKSESLGTHAELFTIADRKHKFFVRNAAAAVPLEVDQVAYGALLPHGKPPKETPAGLDLAKATDRIFWERYSHSGLVVNDDLHVLLVRGDTSPYLRLTPGKATLQLLQMLREDLGVEVRAAIQKVRRTGTVSAMKGIEIKQGRQVREVNVEVQLLQFADGRERCFLILFEEAGLRDQPAAVSKGKQPRDQQLLRAQNELAHTREYVQAIIRDQESTNDE
ncbi:MAG: chemotaxis protein CheB, partial [Bryobacteraceae bacterium]